MTAEPQAPVRTFSPFEGGSTYQLLRRFRLVTKTGRVRGLVLGLAAWLPIALGEVIRLASGAPPDRTWFDLSVHARLLVAVPVMYFAGWLADAACRSALTSLQHGHLCEAKALSAVVERAERLRDSRWPERVLVLMALAMGQLTLLEISGATGVFHAGMSDQGLTFARLWYGSIALPFALFVMFVWLWHWALWGYVLFRIARLPLNLLATHPDHAAGLACVARPVSAFGGFAFAIGAVLASAWGSQLLAGTGTLKAQLPSLVTFLFITVGMAVVPLLPFCRHLYRVRRRTLRDYGDFASTYVQQFHARWLEVPLEETRPLGTPDLQSLADLANAFNVANKTRLFVFGMRSVVAVWGGAILPMVPLLLSLVTLEQILKRVVSTVLGGLPL